MILIVEVCEYRAMIKLELEKLSCPGKWNLEFVLENVSSLFYCYIKTSALDHSLTMTDLMLYGRRI